MSEAAHPAHACATDVARKERTKPVPPQPHRLVANVDPALEQQILDVSQTSGKRTYISTTSRITSGDELK